MTKRKNKNRESIIVQKPWDYIGISVMLFVFECFEFYAVFFSDWELSYVEVAYVTMFLLALLILWLVAEFVFWRFNYKKEQFQIQFWYGKRKIYQKEELKSALEYYSWPQRRMALVLYFADGKKIALNESYRGYKEFHSFLKRNHYPIKVVE